MSTTDTREHILRQAFILLLKKGYDGVSITDLQQATGMARGLLYHYFGNKDQLFVEATTHYFLSLFCVDLTQVQSFDVTQMIHHTVNQNKRLLALDSTLSTEGITIMDYDYLFYRVIRQSITFAKQYRQYRLQERNAWRVALDNSYNKGLIRPDVDTYRTAGYIINLMDGLWMDAVDNNRSDTLVTELHTTLTDYYRLICQ